MLIDWIHWISSLHLEELLLVFFGVLFVDGPRYALIQVMVFLWDFVTGGYRWLRGARDTSYDHCPSVCVILAGYNESDTIDATLRSIWGSYPRLEIIVVDDGSEDAMYSVPHNLREASYGLGATRRTTSLRVVVPAAVSGIVASLIVAFSRAIGETMIVAIAAGGVGGAVFSINPCLPGQTMTGAMTVIAIGSDAVGGGVAFNSLFFIGLLLFFMTLGLNLVSEHFVRRMRKGY